MEHMIRSKTLEMTKTLRNRDESDETSFPMKLLKNCDKSDETRSEYYDHEAIRLRGQKFPFWLFDCHYKTTENLANHGNKS